MSEPAPHQLFANLYASRVHHLIKLLPQGVRALLARDEDPDNVLVNLLFGRS